MKSQRLREYSKINQRWFCAEQQLEREAPRWPGVGSGRGTVLAGTAPGPAASPFRGALGWRDSDPSPVLFQALLQKRSTSVITTWLSSPFCRVGRRTGEDFHPALVQSSSRAEGWEPRGGRGHGDAAGERARSPVLPWLLPGTSFIALGFGRRCRRPWPWTRSGRGSCRARRRDGRTGSPGRAAFSCKDLKGLILSFYVLPDCKFLNFLYSLWGFFAYGHPCCFEFTVCFSNAQFHWGPVLSAHLKKHPSN